MIPTLREVPQEAEIRSHQLLLRAGLARRLAGGLYSFLPLGLRSLRKVERIVREEMDRAGALEVLMPALQPAEIWTRSGRLSVMGDAMFHVGSPDERALVLGPTHEEVVTLLVAQDINSYRQLPRTLYQIQTKFRNEIRPRFGLMRAREFIMKDAYSFDMDAAAAEASYRAMYDAYVRIFRRCGLRTKVVEADTGAMGGRSSHEFMVPAASGEDGIVECDHCSYAANLERAEGRTGDPRVFADADAAVAPVPTPDARTIAEVSALLKAPAEQFIKTLIYLADGNPVAVLIPGDRDVNEIKLQRALGAQTLGLADDARVEETTGAPVGFAGPVGLNLRTVADVRLRGCRGAITGANAPDTHLLHLDLARDGGDVAYEDLTLARAGDGCPRCAQGVLREHRGIEVGHVFNLGTTYTEALGAGFLDPTGARHPSIMGCYGIGVSRTLQAVIEQRNDEHGICWPVSVAPFAVALLCLNTSDPACAGVAESLYDELLRAGVEVLFDDRDERPGVKFKDADLIGFPLRLAVGERGLKRGVVEIRHRETGEMHECPPGEICACVQNLLAAALHEGEDDGKNV